MIPKKIKEQSAGALIYFSFIALGLSFYFSIWFQSNSFSIDNHSFSPPVFLVLVLSAVFFIALVLLWRSAAFIESKVFEKEISFFLNKDLLSFVPLGLSLFSPLILSHYLTAGDLKVRLKILGALMVGGFLVIKWVQFSRSEKGRECSEKILNVFKKIPTGKKILVLFLFSLVIYNICSLMMIRNGRDFTGDEPYYLLTAHSLYKDQDINVANNYADKDYFHFYSKEKYPGLKLGMYARTGKKGNQSIYPINLPGISVLMLPHYWLGQFFEGETRTFILSASLSFWAALLGVQLFLLFQDIWGREKISLFFWFLYSFTVPVLFYSVHLYPEIVAAFLSLYVFRKVRFKKSISVFQVTLCGFFLAPLFWLGLKYNMIFWPLFLVSIYFLLKEQKVRWKIICFMIFPAVSMVLFSYFVYSLYGTINPISLYEGIMTPEKIKAFKELVLSIPVWLRIDSFFDYFLDQRDGLLLYAPFYFFMLTGLIEMFRRSKKDFISVLFISLPFLLNYAFLTHRQGYCPQGRILTPLSWILMWLVGYFFIYNKKKIYSCLFFICCMVSVIIVVILLTHPSFLYQSTTHIHTFRAGDLFLFLSSLHIYVPGFLPSFIKVNNLSYVPNFVWLGLLIVFMVGYLYKKDRFLNIRSNLTPVFTSAGFILLFFWLVLYPRVVLIHPEKADYPTGEKLTFYSLSRAAEMKQAGEFRLSQDNRSYQFFFTSWRKIKRLEVEFKSLQGGHRVVGRYFDRLFFDGQVSEQGKSTGIQDLPCSSYKNANLYLLEVKVSRISPDAPRSPLYLSIRPQY